MKLELFKKDEKSVANGSSAGAEDSTAVMIPPENDTPRLEARVPPANSQPRTVNWTTLRHVTVAQMGLSMIAAVCVLGTVFFGSLTPRYMWYKTSIFFWVLYLISTAYCGYRSGPKSYCHLVAYFVMSILQTVINGVWLSFTTMVVFHTLTHRDLKVSSPDDWIRGGFVAMELVETASLCLRIFTGMLGPDDWIRGGFVAMELVETASLCLTIFTGMLGIVTCCKGLGRLLEHVDSQIIRGVRF